MRYLLEREFGALLKNMDREAVNLDISYAEGFEKNLYAYSDVMKHLFDLMDQLRAAPTHDQFVQLGQQIIAETDTASELRQALVKSWLRTCYKLIQRDSDFKDG